MKPTLVIAGASGFIGRWFISEYAHKYNIRALSRAEVVPSQDSNVQWEKVNLYSLSSTTKALEGADYALYLVHSMAPSSRLNQGTFEDTDLLLADNFARAAEAQHLKHIVFIGGILPKDSSTFSTHLRSRFETEQTLKSRSTPVTAIRAGIIIGPGGSSFDIIQKLTERLPIMACPEWCKSPSQPIGVQDMLQIIDKSIGEEAYYHSALEVGSPEVLSYMDLLKITARQLGKKRLIFSIPFFTLGFSKLWVGLFSNSSTTFVGPLIESLKHNMTLDPEKNLFQDIPYQPIEESIADALTMQAPSLPKRIYAADEKNTVRSVQRLSNPGLMSASSVAEIYPKWLTENFVVILKAEEDGNKVRFKFLGSVLLELSFVAERSDKNRHLFYITGGFLVKRTTYGWLEFRSVLDNRFVIAAIHEFVPKLPWYFYRFSQAVFHLFVMNWFGRFLEKQTKNVSAN